MLFRSKYDQWIAEQKKLTAANAAASGAMDGKAVYEKYCVACHGAGVAGAVNVDVIRRNVSARIEDGSLVHAGEDVTVKAHAEHFVRTATTGYGAAGIVGIAGGLSAIAIGGGIDTSASAQITSMAREDVNQLLVLSGGIPGLPAGDAAQKVEAALADCDLTIDAALSTPVTAARVSAEIGSAIVTAEGDITVKAEHLLGAITDVGATAAGGIAGVGGSAGFIDISGTTTANLGNGATLDAGGLVDVEALTDSYTTGETDSFRMNVTTGNGGLVGIGSAVA